MARLTKTEEEIMQLIWRLERCTVSELLNELGEPRPPHSTISSIVRILEKKGFVGHKAYGRTYEYYPLMQQSDYSKTTLKKIAQDYFAGSMNQLVSFIVEEESLSQKDLADIFRTLKNKKGK